MKIVKQNDSMKPMDFSQICDVTDQYNKMAASHEELRLLVVRLVAQLGDPTIVNKELISLAQEVISGGSEKYT